MSSLNLCTVNKANDLITTVKKVTIVHLKNIWEAPKNVWLQLLKTTGTAKDYYLLIIYQFISWIFVKSAGKKRAFILFDTISYCGIYVEAWGSPEPPVGYVHILCK